MPLFPVAHWIIELVSARTCDCCKRVLIRLGLRTIMEKMINATAHRAFSVAHASYKDLRRNTGLFVHVLQRFILLSSLTIMLILATNCAG